MQPVIGIVAIMINIIITYKVVTASRGLVIIINPIIVVVIAPRNISQNFQILLYSANYFSLVNGFKNLLASFTKITLR